MQTIVHRAKAALLSAAESVNCSCWFAPLVGAGTAGVGGGTIAVLVVGAGTTWVRAGTAALLAVAGKATVEAGTAAMLATGAGTGVGAGTAAMMSTGFRVNNSRNLDLSNTSSVNSLLT